MPLSELAHKQSSLSNEPENEATTSTETGLSNLNAGIFRREFKVQGQTVKQTATKVSKLEAEVFLFFFKFIIKMN